MALLLELDRKSNSIFSADQSTMDVLQNGYVGTRRKGILELGPEEALYLLDIRKAECNSSTGAVSFNGLADLFCSRPKLMARYLTYKDWKDRGLSIAYPEQRRKASRKVSKKRYSSRPLKLPRMSLQGIFFPDDLITVLSSSEDAKYIYKEHWFGQYGTYKASDRGSLNKLDVYETLFLMKARSLQVQGMSMGKLAGTATRRRSDFQKLYSVYEDWRRSGYVVKTGFKFGAHFRIYFPGAKPDGSGPWLHSKHVIHVFPRDVKLLISEWARAIRVAHSVRKTFILAIPGKSRQKSIQVDFLLYHRKGQDTENPKEDSPRYAMLSLGEDEYIGGAELSSAIHDAETRGCDLIVAIADRETAVTYYKVKRIQLSGSQYEYYEIDWMQP